MPNLPDNPIDTALDANDDIEIPQRYTSGPEAVVQGIKLRLERIKGEWFRDLDNGIDWLEDEELGIAGILGSKFDASEIRAKLYPAAALAPGVTSVARFDVTFDGATRVMSVDFEVRTVSGENTGDSLVLVF